MRLIRAWLMAEQSEEAPGCDRPIPAPLPGQPFRTERCGSCASCRRYKATIVVAVESAVLDAQERQGRRILGKYYYRLPEAVRPLLGRRNEDGLKRLLGCWVKWDKGAGKKLQQARDDGIEVNQETGWIAGVAGLTEREARAYWGRIRGWTTTDIQREMTDERWQHDRSRWVAAATVYQYCWRARVKVLGKFGLDLSGSIDEEMEAMDDQGQSDA